MLEKVTSVNPGINYFFERNKKTKEVEEREKKRVKCDS